MQTFFDDMDSIERLTSSLQSDPSLQCKHCFKSDHLMSHGFVYKQRSMSLRETVGKRIICCNRYGHQGCGRTIGLNIASQLPNRRYDTTVLFSFISLLLLGSCVCSAYCRATNQQQSRHAWRWIKQLTQNLTRYRNYLGEPKSLLTAPES